MLRTRWAAIGAAVAVSLGAGGIGVSFATISSGERAVYVPITPCRLADLRPAPDTVGPRTSPLGPDETETFDGWGAVGNCELPAGTAGLALNVTALNATTLTNLRFFPAGEEVPTAANLNPAPGQPPIPNAVNVALDGSGQFSVYNRFGSVNVVIDVVGYYEDHDHDDRYYTEAELDAVHDEVDARLDDLEQAQITEAVIPFFVVNLDTTEQIRKMSSFEVPGPGVIELTAVCAIHNPTGSTVRVRFYLSPDGMGGPYLYQHVAPQSYEIVTVSSRDLVDEPGTFTPLAGLELNSDVGSGVDCRGSLTATWISDLVRQEPDLIVE